MSSCSGFAKDDDDLARHHFERDRDVGERLAKALGDSLEAEAGCHRERWSVLADAVTV